MYNKEIRKFIKELNISSQEVLQLLLSDAIMEISYRNRVNNDTLRRIALVYLSLFDDEDYLEYEKLKLSERNIICRIISKGIASIYVDDEYITKKNTMDKLVIMDDLIKLLCFFTGFNKSTVKRLVVRDIKIYFCKGWSWNFL